MPDDELLVEILECQNDTKIGHIVLNSPETLNSLNLNMVNQISDLLDQWEKSSQIKMVFISGSGEKAFCAGGDIRALYESMCSDEGPVFAEDFFESEYRLDYKLHNYPKPVISVLDGIVMGGGAGLMFASSYRIATERTRFAMPEIGVGLFPDVGFTHEIKKLPKGLGLYIMLTATNLLATDTIFCKLTDGILNSKDFDSFYKDMKSLAWKGNYEDNIKLLDSLINQKKYSLGIRDIPESKIEKELIKIQKLTEGENLVSVVANILSNSSEDDWYRKGKQSLQNGSPTSAHLIWLQCENSLKLNLKEVFLFELNLAVQITRKGDFKEGVRALIVDKDNNPKWKFNSIEKVSQDWINQHTESAWETNPLEDL